MIRLKRITAAVILILLSGCGSDPEGPVSQNFIDQGTYIPGGGETFCEIIPMASVTSNIIETDVGGQTSMLKFGRNRNLEFNHIFLAFDSDSLDSMVVRNQGKSVEEVVLYLPLISSPDCELRFGIYPLEGSFTEDDTLSGDNIPGIGAEPVPDESGSVQERVLATGGVNEFGIDTGVVQDWVDLNRQPWEHGIALMVEEQPDSMGFFEFYSINYGEDPVSLRIYFSDSSGDTIAVNKDYCVPDYQADGELAVVGGAASRLHFTFDLETVSDSAMIHYSALVLEVEGGEGFGASVGETNPNLGLNLDPTFFSYLYAPDSDNPGDDSFWEGTGVDRQSFFATRSRKIEFPLRGYTNDVLYGSRENMGLVLQSDLENIRFQKVSFYSGPVDSLEPYIKIIYSLPAEFK
jgi:hypothetical protein